MSTSIKGVLLVALLGSVLGGFVLAGVRQKAYLNLSATAGGQYPYLHSAKRMAEEGGATYFGDRNRMPLVPALVSRVYVPDWTTFFDRSVTVAIITSTVLLVLVGVVCFAALPRAPATFVTLFAAVCVFVPTSSFVQAELAFYTFFFAAWVIMCRVIHRPDWRWAAVAGGLCGVAFWAKASAWPLMVAFAVVMVLRSALVLRERKSATKTPDDESQLVGPASVGIVAVLVFLVIAGPYLRDTKQRFGRYLYNVNSTFFLWCDSWAEAKEFGDTFGAEQAYPQVPADVLPSAGRYWRTHSFAQMGSRFRYGAFTLANLAYRAPYCKYIVLLAILACFVAWKRKRLVRLMRADEWLVVLFCALIGCGYLTAYAWYALVAFGDRFVVSLLLPVAFALTWFVARFGRSVAHVTLAGGHVRLAGLTFALCTSALVLEGIGEVAYGVTAADAPFVQFYFNESREAQRSGDTRSAVRGYQGVLELDPTFAPAHHEMGMLALERGQLDDALHALTEAVRYRENDANMLNSLGSVLIRLGRLPEAVRALTLATTLDPDFISAWYNLGGAYHLLGDTAGAERAADRLDELDPGAAKRLRELIES